MNHSRLLLLNVKYHGIICNSPTAYCWKCIRWTDIPLLYPQYVWNGSPGIISTSRTRSLFTKTSKVDNTMYTKTHIPKRQQCTPIRGLSGNLTNLLGFSKGSNWNKAVTEAEKIVGYPTSFLSLRCLLSDEFSNVALHIRKLVGTKHPLLKTARRFVFDGTDSLQMRGLLVLLVAKAAGPGYKISSAESDVLETMVSGIYPSQRTLAEITEMIHTAHLVHMGIVNITDMLPTDGSPRDIQFGNKLSVLCGDFLLANASTSLARLYNTEVVDLISSAIRDMMVAEFMRSDTNLGDSLQDGNTVSKWERQTFLATGSLLAKSCKGALMLGKHGPEQQEAAFQLGTKVGCAYQLHEDLRELLNPDSDSYAIHLSSLPVSLHLQRQPDDAQFITGLSNPPSKRSHKKLVSLLSASGAVDRARSQLFTYQQEAMDAVSILGENEARTAITNIIQAVTEF